MLEETYLVLRQHELTHSQYDFSTYWCGMSRSYLSWLKASGAQPSYKALAKLAAKLTEEAKGMNEQPDSAFPEVAAHDVQMLNNLRQQVITALLAR